MQATNGRNHSFASSAHEGRDSFYRNGTIAIGHALYHSYPHTPAGPRRTYPLAKSSNLQCTLCTIRCTLMSVVLRFVQHASWGLSGHPSCPQRKSYNLLCLISSLPKKKSPAPLAQDPFRLAPALALTVSSNPSAR